jgi:hypothetical protein
LPPLRIESAIAVPGQSFKGLSPEELAHLTNWSRAALASGIDGVEDMMARPWPCPTADAIIGVFRFGEELASFLVIGQDGAWVVANCADGTVSRQVGSLDAALSQLHRLDETM